MKRILLPLAAFLLLGSLSASVVAMAAAPTCLTLHSSLRSCAMDTDCEWNPFISACQERCSSHSLKAECMAPTCKWYGNVSHYANHTTNSTNSTNSSVAYSFSSSSSAASWLTNASYCGSSCSRFNNSTTCNAAPGCLWLASTCTTNPWQPAAHAAFVLEILSAQLAELLTQKPASALASFALAVQQDLMAAYGSSTSIVMDSRGINVNLARLVVTVDYLASTSVVPTVIANDMMQPATWLTSTSAFFAAFGGTTALIVGSVMPVNTVAPHTSLAPDAPRSTASPRAAAKKFSTTVAVLIAVGCAVVVAAVVEGIVVLYRRHNAVATESPFHVVAVQPFTPEELEWLKAANERVVTYDQAIALEQKHAALGSKTTCDVGPVRFIVTTVSEDDGACGQPYGIVHKLRADTPDSCNLVKELFESSQLCSHVGGNDARKVAYARLAAADSFLVPALSDSGCEVGLRGVPRSWAPSVVETAVKLMIRVGCRHLVEGASPSWAEPHVRAQPSANAVGEWRISVHPPQALGVLVAVSCRFWGLDGDVLCCQCTSGIAITPAQCCTPPDRHWSLVHAVCDADII